MTNLTALIAKARNENLAATAASGKPYPNYSDLREGNVVVRIVPVQPRGLKSWSPSCIRADVYIDGRRIQTAELKELLKAEAA